MLRQSFSLENNQVFTNGRLVEGISYAKENQGMRNKVKILKDGKIIGFLKSSKVSDSDYYSDYAELATKKICDQVGIKCADCILADIKGLQKTEAEIELDQKSDEFIRTLSPEQQTIAIEYRKQQELLKAKQKGVLSYNYLETPKYRGCQKLNLFDICEKYSQFTNEDIPKSVNGYIAVLEFLCKNPMFAKSLGIAGDITIDENLKYDFLSLAMLSFFTGQMDMTIYNIDVVARNTPEGKKIEMAPLYDNSESLGLSSIERKIDYSTEDFEYYKKEVSENMVSSYASQLTIREETPYDVEEQAQEIADVIRNDVQAKEIFDKFKDLDLESIIDSLDIGETGFDMVSFAIDKFYSTRINEVEKHLSVTKEKPLDKQT